MKKFLIIGSANAVTTKDIFPLIKDNKIWLGTFYGSMEFIISADKFDETKCSKYRVENGEYYIKLMMITWYTNMEHNKRKEPLVLTKKYDPALYPKYENYNAINVDKVKDIPIDYDGIMGVPITFLDKYCPSQFEIVGCADASVTPNGWKGMSKEFVELYYAQGNTGQYQEGNRLACFLTNDGKAKVPYKRILIKRVSKNMKKFLIIGNSNAITYKSIFPHIASCEWFLRTGKGDRHCSMSFLDEDGERKDMPSLWYTNLDSRHLYQELELTKKYDPEKYPKYDNFDGIEVSKLRDIPCDYDGVMGVPISVVLFSPNQFEIVGSLPRGGAINGHFTYKRILVKRKKEL